MRPYGPEFEPPPHLPHARYVPLLPLVIKQETLFKMRLYHQCWIEFLDKWAEKTSNPEMLLWANGESRWTQFFLLDCWGISKKQTNTQWKFVICHRCKAPRNSYLHTQSSFIAIGRRQEFLLLGFQSSRRSISGRKDRREMVTGG